MQLVPEWAPNVHPLIVHFPVALLVAAALLDAVSLVLRKQTGWRLGAVAVYVLGAIGAVGAYFTGKAAADSVLLPTDAQRILTEHADWAEFTVWFFGVYALVRLGLFWAKRDDRPALHLVVFLLGAGGLVLLYETAEHGGQMVFQYGVGVQAVAPEDPLATAPPTTPDGTAGPQTQADGWTWKPTRAAAWKDAFTWIEGAPAAVAASLVEDAAHGDVLALSTEGTPVLFTFDQAFESLQADLAVNLDDFAGVFQIVHHVQNAQTYHFLALENGTMQQGRVEAGTVALMDEKAFDGGGWQRLRLVADGTHFRGYAGSRLVVHGHGPAPSPGPVGLRLAGRGTVRLDQIRVQALR